MACLGVYIVAISLAWHVEGRRVGAEQISADFIGAQPTLWFGTRPAAQKG